MSSKAGILTLIRETLATHLQRLEAAAREAHAAATDPGSKAEGKYDTRSLEASYLASGQARQVAETAAALQLFTALELPDFDLTDAIGPGALVELDADGETQYFLLAPAAGGVVIEHEGREITLLTPDSPLHAKLLGLTLGDTLPDSDTIITELQ